MVQEGVTFSLGLLTPGGDAQWVVAAGIPMAVVLAVGIGLLLTGIIMTSWQLSRVIFDQDAPFWSRFLVVLVGISSLMLVRAIHATMAAPALTTENLIPLIFSVLLASIVVFLQNPLATVLNKARRTPRRISWPSVASAMALGMAMFLFQVVV
jgi:glycerol uptake facilitator-like aquaporin